MEVTGRRVPHRTHLLSLLFVLIPALVPFHANAAGLEGVLDQPFGTDGKVTTAVGPSEDVAAATAVQPDGKIVVAGSANNGSGSDFAVVRYNKNGSLDTSFDTDGKVLTPIGSEDLGRAMVLQPDGKIVVAGGAYGSNYDFAIVRYNPNGSLDTSFSSDGKVTTPIGSAHDIAVALALQPDGKLVAAGSSDTASDNDFAVVRYNADGSPDTSFDTDGKVTTSVATFDDVHGVALQADGKIVVVGSSYNGSNYDFSLVRYNTDGSPDMSFDGDGKVTTSLGSGYDDGRAVVVQPDGKIVVAGSAFLVGSQTAFAMARYKSDGSLDSTFGMDGKAYAQETSISVLSAVALQPDGRIVGAGYATTSGTQYFALVRLKPSGNLDPAFDYNGTLNISVGTGSQAATAVALQPDGKIVAAGYGAAGAFNDFAVVRFIGDATAPYAARMIGVPSYSTALTRGLAWTASDDNTGVKNFDVRYRSAAYNSSSYGSYSTLKSATTLPYGSFTGSVGRTYCFFVRGRDYAGNVGLYGDESCMELPVDERTMAAGGTWSKFASSSYYRGTGMVSSSSGSTLKLSVRYRHLGVLVTTCSGCGTIKVYLGSTLLKTVNLSASSTHRKVLIAIDSSAGVKGGTLTIKQASGGKKVYIDGVKVSLA
jgi:uncharacterized delta-60 repeat protein